MPTVIIDTNVIITANEKCQHASISCVLKCQNTLTQTKNGSITAVDQNGLIFAEYWKYANRSGQPGVGDYFVKWLFANQANPKHCEYVQITQKGNDPYDFLEFPDDDELKKFDNSDKKFVAVACASKHTPKPYILNATDSDWQDFRVHLEKHGLAIQFLCPDMMKQKPEQV